MLGNLISKILTCLHHGQQLGSMKLPLVPMTFGTLSKALSFYAVGFLEGVDTAEHDWHHEK